MRATHLPVLLLASAAILAGCLGDDPNFDVNSPLGGVVSSQTVWLHDALGQLLDPSTLQETLQLATTVYSVGQPGAEPSIGISTDGTVFFQAFEKTYRSKDHGRTWQRVAGPLTATGSSDPYLVVDQTTNRVFQINQGIPFGGRGPVLPPLPPESPVTYSNIANALFCTHIAWSDNQGASWLANPIDCGPLPGVDHIKLATGPWIGQTASLRGNPAYPNAVYFAYNKAFAHGVGVKGQNLPDQAKEVEMGGWMAVSLDGGATFPIATEMFPKGCNGGLHGDIAVGPDGWVYVPARYCPAPLVAFSGDNGRTWERILVGETIGVPEQSKNPAMAVDKDNNVYLTWVGKDNRLWLSHSTDHARTWSPPITVSPPSVGAMVWPTMVAGDKGRIGIAYIGTEQSTKGPWEVDNSTLWHLYYTHTLNALDQGPVFVTIRATEDGDPVQRGTICVTSSKCKDGNRNLLDFIDMELDTEGRPYVAYADGCTTVQCLRPGATHLDSRARDGMVMVLEHGPSLLANKASLVPFK